LHFVLEGTGADPSQEDDPMNRLALYVTFGLAGLPCAAGAHVVHERDRTETLREVATPGAVVTTTTIVRRSVGSPVEVRAVDRDSRTVTVVQNGNAEHVFAIAADALDELAPGQQALLSWRFNREGKAEAIIRVTPAAAIAAASADFTARTAPARAPGPVVVISTDPEARTLTIRGEGEVSQTVPVDELALVSLLELRPGDSVLLSWGGDRVIVITRK
jgi:hypothetical protein